MHQRDQHEIETFPGVAESAQTGNYRIGVESRHLRRHREFRKFDPLLLQPRHIGALLREISLDLVIGHQLPFFKVDEKHASRLKASFPDNVLRREIKHTDFARHDHTVIRGDIVAAGPQPVAVKHSADTAPVSKSHR